MFASGSFRKTPMERGSNARGPRRKSGLNILKRWHGSRLQVKRVGLGQTPETWVL